MTGYQDPPPPPASRLTVDLAALAANWRDLAAASGPAVCGAAVKANAYGLGLAPVAKALAAAGCRQFFVALPGEGEALRAVLPEVSIHVLNGFAPGSARFFRTHALTPVLNSQPEIDAWLEAGGGDAPTLHVDTGMNRLGLSLGEAERLADDRSLVDRLRPAVVMSHLACADDPAHPLTGEQAVRFRSIRARFPGAAGSLANSAGLMSARADLLHDLTRPGIAIYGSRWSAAMPPLRPVATLEARILQVRDVAEGEAVGYGATFTARRRSRIAILSAGYADGYIRAAGNGAAVAVEGHRAPLAGRVSMDLIAVDVTDVPAALARPGAMVELFGPTIGVDEVAARAGTIGYEVLTGAGRRAEIVYRS